MSQNQTGGARTNHTAVTVVVCIALAAVVSAMASLNVALPDIARSTHASQTQLSWVIDAYSLVFAALLLPAGALGDRFGRRRALLVGLAIFGLGSAAAMSVSSASTLIGVRAVLGLGAALVMPATLSTITSTFPAAERVRAVSVWAAVAGGSAVVGLLASGLLLKAWSWQAVFGLNVGLAAVAAAGTLWAVPESADVDAPKLDVGGAVLAAVGLLVLVYAVIEAPSQGWLSLRTLLGVGIGLLVLIGFIGWELRQKEPLLNPRVYRLPRLAAGSMSIFVQFFAFFGFTFVILQYFQLVRGDSPLVAAVSVLPLAGTLMPVSRLTPALVVRLGARLVCTAGLALMSVAFVVLAFVGSATGYLHIAVGLVLLGAGMGAAMTPATSGITDALPPNQQGVGSALNDLSRELGGALGIAVIGSVFDAIYRSSLHLPGVAPALAARARSSFAVTSHLGGSVRVPAQNAFVDGMHAALICAALASGLAAIGVLRLLAPRAVGESETRPTQSGSMLEAR